MSKQQYILPKDWKSFQHYKDRDPTWIKLHLSLLNDYKFTQMTEIQQLVCIKLWLLFAEQNHDLALDSRFISGRMGVSSIVLGRVISVLVSNGFIELVDKPASEVLAERYRNASPKKVRDKIPPVVPQGDDPPDYEKCLDIWNQVAKANTLPTASLTDKRRKALKARLKDHSVEEFTTAVQAVPADPFRLGKTDRGNWRANFDWLLRPDTITKLLEEAPSSAPRPGSLEEYEMQRANKINADNWRRAKDGQLPPLKPDGSEDLDAPRDWGEKFIAAKIIEVNARRAEEASHELH